jgi:hypothetical protein
VAQPPDSFSYAVVRVVPDIEREEFLNAGLILYCRPRRFLAARTRLDEKVLGALRRDCDVDAIREQLRLVERIATGEPDAGPIAGLEQTERFHWLTTPRSTLIQPGPIHAGVTDDPTATFEHLFSVLVDRPA